MRSTEPPPGRLKDIYRLHFANHRRERLFLSSVSFFTTFAGVRALTHAIRSGRSPVRNLSEGGVHIHHLVWGILGLLGVGYAWTYRWGIGPEPGARWPSRVTAALYGAASALTLDEFALWLDLHDDYWNRQGRKSIDAVAIFAGLLTMGVAGRGALRELGLLPEFLVRQKDKLEREAASGNGQVSVREITG